MRKALFLIPALLCAMAANAQWIQTTNTTSRELVYHNSRLIGGGGSSGGILISDDEGATWTPSNTGVPAGAVTNIGPKLVIGNTIFAVSVNEMYTSTNNGASWAAAAPTLPATSIISIVYYDGSTIFVTYQSGKVYTSSDGGTTFSLKGDIGFYPVAMASFNGKLYAGTNTSGMYTSANGGATWAADNTGIGTNDRSVYAMNSFGGSLYMGTYSGKVYRLSGGSWAQQYSGNPVRDLYSKNNVIMAATDNGYAGSTDGTTWASANTGLSGNDLYFLHIYSTNANVFVTKFYGGVLKRGFGELGINTTTGIKNAASNAPGSLYPNPVVSALHFNTTAGIPQHYVVTDITGRNVAAGNFNGRRDINIDGIAAGIYTVRIHTSEGIFNGRFIKQ